MKKGEDLHRSLPALKFLLLILVSGIVLTVFVCVFLLPQRTSGILDLIMRFPSKAHSLFQFCDDWNILLISFLFCVAVIIYCLNDILLKKYIPQKGNGFYSSGGFWLLRNCTNLIVFFLQCGIACFVITHSFSTPSIYTNLNELPKQKFSVLLLGTSKYVKQTSKVNFYYQARIDAVVELYKQGRVSSIIISGDKHGSYDETRDMKDDLIAAHIPAKRIFLDSKGFRTFDSIVRMQDEQGNSQTVIVVSQFFHLERAIFLARQSGLNAIGFAAEGNMTLGMIQREFLAKPRVLLDIYLFNTQVSGVPAHPRRAISLARIGDVLILAFVFPLLIGSGRLTRQLLDF